MFANAVTCGAHKAPEPTMVSYACKRQQMWHTQTTWNKCVYTPGTAGGPGGRDRMLALKSKKKRSEISLFS